MTAWDWAWALVACHDSAFLPLGKEINTAVKWAEGALMRVVNERKALFILMVQQNFSPNSLFSFTSVYCLLHRNTCLGSSYLERISAHLGYKYFISRNRQRQRFIEGVRLGGHKMVGWASPLDVLISITITIRENGLLRPCWWHQQSWKRENSDFSFSHVISLSRQKQQENAKPKVRWGMG